MSGLPGAGLIPNPALLPGAAGLHGAAGIIPPAAAVMMSQPQSVVSQPAALAAAIQGAAAAAAAVNPILQQTIHQRQKLPSPISELFSEMSVRHVTRVCHNALFRNSQAFSLND